MSPKDRFLYIQDALHKAMTQFKQSMFVNLTGAIIAIFIFAVLAVSAEERGVRGNALVLLILISLGFLAQWVSPLRYLRDIGELRGGAFFNIRHDPLQDVDIIKAEPASSQEELERQLAEITEVLRARRDRERDLRSLPVRLATLTAIAVANLVIWLVFDEPVLALINAVVGIILTQGGLLISNNAAMRACAKLQLA